MRKERRRLGRGLDSLISQDYAQPLPDAPSPLEGETPRDQAHPSAVPIESIKRNPYQPRTEFPERGMGDLVQSIRRTGILQPLVVRPSGDGWELIAGERRLRAAIQAGLNDVPVLVRDAGDEEVLEMALIENIHREDLNAMERARAYRTYGEEFKIPVEEIAKRVGEDRSTVANYLRLLELSDDIQWLVADRSISMGHARCLLAIASQEERWELAAAVVENDLSVRALEEIVRRRKQRGATRAQPFAANPQARPLVRAIQEELTTRLGTGVSIREGRKPNTGRIVIEYHSLDDFNRITEALGLRAS